MLGNYGISLNLSEADQVFGNVTGGLHQGAAYNGLTTMGLTLDTQKAFGIPGGLFNISALQLHGRSISNDNLDVLQAASGNEADDATRLWELWYQQTFLNGKLDIKIGQQAFDQEFMLSQYGSVFLNSVMGSPEVPAADLYAGGGPQYPLSSLGVRVRAQPLPSLTTLVGVFDDNPPGGPFNNDSALRGAEASGTAFNLNTGALWIGELQYQINGQSTDGKPTGLPGTYKIGAWYDSGSFPDQRYDTLGQSLANPASNGDPFMHHGNYGIYAVADQAIWRPAPKASRLLGAFAEVSAAPADRNLVSFSATAGLNLADPLPGRDSDTAAIGFGIAKISGAAAGLDQDTAFYSQSAGPTRTTETFFELTYQFQATGWWQIQPDFQYFIRPGGGIQDPTQPDKLIGNEAVFGLQSSITF